jgi:hypothetical protein
MLSALDDLQRLILARTLRTINQPVLIAPKNWWPQFATA